MTITEKQVGYLKMLTGLRDFLRTPKTALEISEALQCCKPAAYERIEAIRKRGIDLEKGFVREKREGAKERPGPLSATFKVISKPGRPKLPVEPLIKKQWGKIFDAVEKKVRSVSARSKPVVTKKSGVKKVAKTEMISSKIAKVDIIENALV